MSGILEKRHGDCQLSEHGVFVPVTQIEALCEELNAKRYKHARPGIQEQGWGKVMEVADPFGNRLRFCELSLN
ncbi:glyoxalase superfamily protein [Pseudomonas sp. GD03842]|uniref:glyoxalase superfamily protein n=1 Tax=Pseudomonas sp. GD03842 TaxID=2975385 RepID=UPI002448D891|nr:glyoxalase superfamily protein [Pseudomonas sp. GD03842]MDH0745577.1 glyoxalase superfamily protein [Pseudomonas sp. GD03842]